MPRDDSEELLQTALAYAECGWGVFPVYEPGTSPSRCSCGAGLDQTGQSQCSAAKHPRTRNGHRDASTDPKVIRVWWTRWPNANIGIATGTLSGLVVIDIDPRHGGGESWRDLVAELGLSDLDTPQVITGGGGMHYYFQYPSGHVPSRANIRPGVDVRAAGGYVIAPPSLHASGGRYEWEAGCEPW